VPLDPAYKAGLAGHLPVKAQNSKEIQISNIKVSGRKFLTLSYFDIHLSFEL
jgi:hypothetical protein